MHQPARPARVVHTRLLLERLPHLFARTAQLATTQPPLAPLPRPLASFAQLALKLLLQEQVNAALVVLALAASQPDPLAAQSWLENRLWVESALHATLVSSPTVALLCAKTATKATQVA
jgi:hypothetical protein